MTTFGISPVEALAKSRPHVVGRSNAEVHCPPNSIDAFAKWVVTDEQVKNMQETRMIWRSVVAMSHLSVWSAPGNGGKTSLAKHAAGEMAAAGFDVCFFQEDASAGDLPSLHEHAKTHGYRMLNSTLAASTPEAQIAVLRSLAEDGADLSNCVMFFDTLKKYADLMNKGSARFFFRLMRSLTQRGATVVLLGHTNKYKTKEDKLVFEGVGDVRNDVDELFYIDATDKDPLGVVTLTIRPDKVRCFAKEATFTLNTKTMEVRHSDSVVDVVSIIDANRRTQEDAPVIACIKGALNSGPMNSTDLFKLVSKEGGKSFDHVRDVAKRYSSTNSKDSHALWLEETGLNNARIFSLKTAPPQ